MNIILFSLIFEPDVCSGSYIFSDLASEFIKLGHKVTVITTTPHYDEKNAIEKRKLLTKTKYKWLFKSNYNGAEVHHINVKPRKGNIINRFMTFYKLQTKSLKIVKKLNLKADVIYSQTPPMTIGRYANKIANHLNAKSVFIVQDLWLDAVYQKRKIPKFLYKILLSIEKKEMLESTLVTTLSSEMKEVIANKLENKKTVFVVPNFANTKIYQPLATNYRKQIGYLDTDFVISYVGNIGNAQDLSPLILLAKKNKNIKILIAGNGTKEAHYKHIVEEEKLENIKFLGYVSREETVKINSMSDICAVMLAQHINSYSFPSKIYTIMACEKPILLSSQLDSATSKFVLENKIGLVCDVNDKNAFCNINFDKTKLQIYARNGRRLVNEKFSSLAVAKEYLELVKNA